MHGSQRPSVPSRVQSLQLHHELDLAHLGASTDLNEGRARRRAWQRRLNCQVQQVALQLLFSIFRYPRLCLCPWEVPLPHADAAEILAPPASGQGWGYRSSWRPLGHFGNEVRPPRGSTWDLSPSRGLALCPHFCACPPHHPGGQRWPGAPGSHAAQGLCYFWPECVVV